MTDTYSYFVRRLQSCAAKRELWVIGAAIANYFELLDKRDYEELCKLYFQKIRELGFVKPSPHKESALMISQINGRTSYYAADACSKWAKQEFDSNSGLAVVSDSQQRRGVLPS